MKAKCLLQPKAKARTVNFLKRPFINLQCQFFEICQGLLSTSCISFWLIINVIRDVPDIIYLLGVGRVGRGLESLVVSRSLNFI